jgi:hypothetical protein
MDRSTFAAEFGQHPNNTVALPGSPCPNPIPPPFDTDTDSDTDPEPVSPLTFSHGHSLGEPPPAARNPIFNHRSTQIHTDNFSDLCPSVSICGSLCGTVSQSVRSLSKSKSKSLSKSLEAVRIGSRGPDLPLHSHPESLAQRRRGAVAFSSWLGGEDHCSNPCLLGRFVRFSVDNQACSRSHLNPAPHSPSAPLRLCASSPHPVPQRLQLCPNGLFGQALAIAIEIEIDNKRDSAGKIRGRTFSRPSPLRSNPRSFTPQETADKKKRKPGGFLFMESVGGAA